MSIDLTNMSRAELEELSKEIEKALAAAELQERKKALQAARDAAAQFGFSLEELNDAQKPGTKRAKSGPKYYNPENPEQTWSGRGRKPNWVHTALENGRDISELEI